MHPPLEKKRLNLEDKLVKKYPVVMFGLKFFVMCKINPSFASFKKIRRFINIFTAH